ncbi:MULTISPECIES: DUF433 domain-containing protein [unclassified Bradyrhizobium]|uniref:DUF433 domain-containing protein n=1 Tax=unclassified Bradyrhizobium TaxID=2631580 RepID=UPI002FF2160E
MSAIQRLLERLQTGWRPLALEIDPAVPQRTLVEWDFVYRRRRSAARLHGTLLDQIYDLENTWMTEEVLWLDAGLAWALASDGFYWLQVEVVTRRHGVMGGAACFDGTRIPVRILCSYVLASSAVDDMCRDYPSLSPGAAQTAIVKAFRLLEREAPRVGEWPPDPLEQALREIADADDVWTLQRDPDEADADYAERCRALGCDAAGRLRLRRWQLRDER